MAAAAFKITEAVVIAKQYGKSLIFKEAKNQYGVSGFTEMLSPGGVTDFFIIYCRRYCQERACLVIWQKTKKPQQ